MKLRKEEKGSDTFVVEKRTEKKLRYKYILQQSEINFRIGGCTVYHKCEVPNEKDFVTFMEQILQYKTKDSALFLPSYEPPCQDIDSVEGCLLTTALFNCQLIDNKKNISYSL